MTRWIVALLVVLFAALPAASAPEPPWNNATNCSGSITTGGTAQLLFGGGVHHGYQIQNLSTDILGFSEFTTSPAVGSNGTWQLSASGGSYNSPANYAPGGPVYIIGATTSDAFSCAVW